MNMFFGLVSKAMEIRTRRSGDQMAAATFRIRSLTTLPPT
jgi:hypothetical protein